MGKATGKNRKKRPTLGLGGRVILNRSKRESFLFKKGERKEGKSGVARVGYLGVCLSTPANEKLLSIFHHTHTRESFLDSPI